jgi:competence protein ComGC
MLKGVVLMKKILNNRGYSMIALVIALVIILILAVSSISQLMNSREKTEMMNFIYDINAVQDRVKSYYIEKGTLPTKENDELNMNDLVTRLAEDGSTLRAQLSNYDDDKYYYIDFSQLGALSLKESYRGLSTEGEDAHKGYFVNAGSLKVYVEDGITYKLEGDSTPLRYFTLTSDIVNGQENYEPLDEEIVIVGNPISWMAEAKLRVVLPRRSLEKESWDGWTFRWDFGPKDKSEMSKIKDDDTKRNFKYGDALIVKSNGIYTIYVKDNATNEETILNVNITKIDDVKPKYEIKDDNATLVVKDNETGIKSIMYKTLSAYERNVLEAEATDDDYASRTSNDFYLMDGNGKDVIYELVTEITDYSNNKRKILEAIRDENQEYDRWVAEHPVDGVAIVQEDADRAQESHETAVTEYNEQLAELNAKYPYLADINGSTGDSRLVIYVEDYAGNAIVIGDSEQISTKIIADACNVSLEPLNVVIECF